MKTTMIADKLLDLAFMIMIGDQEYGALLIEAAERLIQLMKKADPLWNKWLILDEGLFLSDIGEDGESNWTEKKDDAMMFDSKADAEKYMDEHFMEIGFGSSVLRGDDDYTYPIVFNFNGAE